MKSRKVKAILGGTATVGLVIALTGCTANSNDSSQANSQNTSDWIGNTAQSAVPYPKTAMQASGWTERQELTENLERQSNKNAVKYVDLITQQGQIIATYPIQGMVFDPNSQLTNSQNIDTGYSNSNLYDGVVDSVGDNGTWGPEAGSAAFFTTSGVEVIVPTGLLWIESDAPLNITSTPIISYNENETPSSSYGNGVKVAGK